MKPHHIHLTDIFHPHGDEGGPLEYNVRLHPASYSTMFSAPCPLTEKADTDLPAVTAEKLSDEDGYSIHRLQFTILEGVVMTGLFFRAEGEEKKPLVIVQHGDVGTPEPARRERDRLLEMCAPVGTDWLDIIEFDGKHEFLRDDFPIERLIADLKTTSE